MRNKLVKEKNVCFTLTLHYTVIQRMKKQLMFQVNTGKWVEQNKQRAPHRAYIRQEVKADPEKKVQATSAETVRCLGAVPDQQQKRFTITQLLLPPEWTCL